MPTRLPAPAAPGTRPPAPPYADTGARLGRAVLGFVVAVVAAITLQPFVFVLGRPFEANHWAGPFDVVANVALFLPLGFLHALTRTATESRTPGAAPDRFGRPGRALLLGLLASGAIELAQVFEPGRYPSLWDVAANGLGAGLGAWLHGRVASRLGVDSPLVGRLALELPVMGLVYVTLPLCTLAAVTVADAGAPHAGLLPLPVRGVGLALLGAFGGLLLGTVQQRQFGPSGTARAGVTALVAAGGFALAALPALATAPGALALGVTLAGGAAWLLGRRADAPGRERRFEAEALGRAAPVLALYLLLLPLGEPALGAATLRKLAILRQVETLAAYTVAGYLVAEALGRRQLRYRTTAPRVATAALLVAWFDTLLRATTDGAPLAPATIALHVAAAGYGGWLYHLQRAHVKALLDARAAAAAQGPRLVAA